MDKIQTLAKNENLLDQVQVFLHNVIIAKIRYFGDVNVVVDICLQANNYSLLIKMPSLSLFPVTQMELNEFGLEIDQENILYQRATYSIGKIHIVLNMLVALIIRETLKLGNDPPITSTLNPKKQICVKFNFLSGSHFSFFCLSEEKKLKAIVIGAGSTETRDNVTAKKTLRMMTQVMMQVTTLETMLETKTLLEETMEIILLKSEKKLLPLKA